jgi:hypothetical protein
MVLHNRTLIKGPLDNEAAVKELFSDNQQYKLIDSCYPWATRYTLDDQEIKRAECAEKNIREYIGNRLEELECEIVYYRPMYIDRRMASNFIQVYAPGATWGSGNFLKIEAKFDNRNSEEGRKKMPEIISKVKEFASKYGVTHVLPHGPVVLQNVIRVLRDPEKDIETFDTTYGRKGSTFTPIENFRWEDYYW